MRQWKTRVADVFRKGDMVLLALSVVSSLFGIVMIVTASAYTGNTRYLTVQTGALIAGVLLYLIMTAIDIDILAGWRTVLFLFNAGLIALLLVFGVQGNTGNLSWLEFPFLPFNIQPAEVCKIGYIIILAKTMSIHRNHVSSLRCVGQLGFHMLFMVAEIILISRDTGVALIFIFIFLVMCYVGGVNFWWFLGGAGAFALAAPTLWQYVIREDQKRRILALYDPTIDPTGLNELWQTNRQLQALRNGGLSGQGLFNGTMTQNGSVPAQHTDAIFCSIGEQLGMIGCLAVLVLLLLVVARVVYVGIKSPDYMNRMICMGIAAMFLFQILINVGMCIGVLPVIGLALPFFSYGGSSLLTTYLALGIVSGIKMRPSRETTSRYIRPW